MADENCYFYQGAWAQATKTRTFKKGGPVCFMDKIQVPAMIVNHKTVQTEENKEKINSTSSQVDDG